MIVFEKIKNFLKNVLNLESGFPSVNRKRDMLMKL